MVPPDNRGGRTGWIGRRPYLRGIGIGALAVSTAGVATGQTTTESDEDSGTAGPGPVATVGDIDGNGRFETTTRREAPVDVLCEGGESTRSGVIHASSGGVSTTDYTASLANVAEQGVTVGDVAEGEVATFDYFEGPESENAAPDEVFIVVDWTESGSDGGSTDGSGDSTHGDDDDEEVTIAFLHVDEGDGGDVDCEDESVPWRTFDLSSAMTEAGWHDATTTSERIETGEMLLPFGILLRDSEPEEESPLDRYGADTTVLAIGVGNGWTTQETVVDTYYDNLEVDGETYDFPVGLPAEVDVDQRGSGAVQVSFSLAGETDELGVDDVDGGSVGLWPYEAVTAVPPSTDGAAGRGFRTRGDTGEFVVPTSALDALESGHQTVIVAGELDVPGAHVGFVGTEELDLAR